MTFMGAFLLNNAIVSLVMVIVEYLAYLWYSLSYISYARSVSNFLLGDAAWRRLSWWMELIAVVVAVQSDVVAFVELDSSMLPLSIESFSYRSIHKTSAGRTLALIPASYLLTEQTTCNSIYRLPLEFL